MKTGLLCWQLATLLSRGLGMILGRELILWRSDRIFGVVPLEVLPYRFGTLPRKGR